MPTQLEGFRCEGLRPWSRSWHIKDFDLGQGALGSDLSRRAMNSDPIQGAFDLVEENYELQSGSRSFRHGRGGHRFRPEVEKL